MTLVGASEVAIFPTFKNFRSETTREVEGAATEAGGKFSSAFSGAVKGIGVGIATVVGAAVAGATAIASKGLDRALNIQDAKAQLTGLGNSVETVDAIMANALDSVRGTAFGLDSAATIAASSVAAGIKPGEALTRTLKLTADAATIGKTSLSEMGDMVNKVATNGKLTTEVLQQFQGRGVPLLQMVADQYGVTAEAAAKMVTEGKVDFATFQSALESGVGGAALSSGSTARGAFANIGAAFSRMGALFVGSAVDGAPSLFTSIAGAVDRATTAVTPFAQQFSSKVTPAMAGLGAWIEKIDFARIVNGIRDFYLGAVDVKDLLTTGFTENETLLPPKAVAGLQTANRVLVGIGDAFKGAVAAFQSGDFAGPMASIGDSLTTLKPALSEFGAQLPNIGGAVSELAAAALPVLSGALGFLADNVDTIIDFMPLIVAGFIAWRVASGATATASIALRTAELAAIPAQITRNGLRLAAASLEYRMASATTASTVAEVTATSAKRAGILATVRQTVVNIASRVALVAGTVATGVATAAQWAWNAALSANPIGLVIAAIAALVAGLVWFFTQTEVGKAAWAAFTQFLSEAWTNIQNGAVVVFTAIGEFFVGFWEGLKAGFNAAIQFLLNLFFNFTPLGILISKWDEIVAFLAGAMGRIGEAVSNGINTALAFFTGLPGSIVATLGDLGSTLLGSGKALIDGFIQGIKDTVGGIGDAIGGALDFAAGFFPNSPAKRGPFSGSGWRKIGSAGTAIFDEFNSGIPSDGFKMAADLTGKVTVGGSSASSNGSAPAGKAPVHFTQENHYADGLSEADVTRLNAEKMTYALRSV